MSLLGAEDTQLLNGLQTKELIDSLIAGSSSCLLLSAYYSLPAFNWLSTLIDKDVKLVVRGSPRDFLAGATNMDAIRKSLMAGWDVRFISALHAKVYLIDDKICIGSGNLTANGMSLFGSANLELNTVLSASAADKKLLLEVFEQGQKYTHAMLDAMQLYLDKNEESINICDWWPTAVVPIEMRKLFCNDFPYYRAAEPSAIRQEYWDDIAACILTENYAEVKRMLELSHAFIWLKDALTTESSPLSFGKLSSLLHSELADDPAPYRSAVKELLANLLDYVSLAKGCGIVVERPNYSQVVRLG